MSVLLGDAQIQLIAKLDRVIIQLLELIVSDPFFRGNKRSIESDPIDPATSAWLIAFQSHPMHHPQMPVIIIQRIMLGTTIIPKRD